MDHFAEVGSIFRAGAGSNGHLGIFIIMKAPNDESSSDPAVHSAHLQREIAGLIDHLHKDIERAPEPQFQALLETSAEVLVGLRNAFEDYGKHAEAAWRSSAKRTI